ncbi:MCE family protein [Mycobacteroides abscessus]|uniref:MCE family protein n=1 Tax=Mycobacteroides abscessus TaxID=36809 RepID=UPI0009A86BDC|nr:MCE family protein [Mycobacteroides abscessus]SKF64281.1 virulence factor Mce family protein [Mycobacteroides abscessus subsp. bolletii]SKH03584.1 virulence factor Mce family protein [Mycobacteroides abscessus subsp. bolletii]SKH09006.1 virulence factor Mce family protein [Mycobacteroides abscessus subsp. bolletii]SKH57548.1 virulence factor Mce family protein [Mycobacteroides abscessus subsp. bolletii]SKH96365.1 virulence factor Mce family protein [Mycobacteroides abscessus subsp. bolletii
MSERARRDGVHPLWWTLGLFLLIVATTLVTALAFSGALTPAVPITLTADRIGLSLEVGGKVQMRGVEVGRVAAVSGGQGLAHLTLDLFPDQAALIPANVEAEIRATTTFGAKYVDLIYPKSPALEHIKANAVLRSRNVTSEVNTVFDNLNTLLQKVDVPKLNAVLTAVADSVRGKGGKMGQAIVDLDSVLAVVNGKTDAIRNDLVSLARVSDTYARATPDLLKMLSSLAVTGQTITRQRSDIDALLLGAAGFARSGISLLAPNLENIDGAINKLRPTTELLYKYNPEYTCLFQGAYWGVQKGALDTDGRTTIFDVGFLGLANDPYKYPDNLPIVAAKGGPDGKPGCGSLPRPDLNFPIRALVTNTGYGTGLDLRPNPGPAHPFGVNFFPATKDNPEAPRVYGEGPPAIGPVPYPGAPPYGAPLYGPNGEPLWAAPPPGSPPPPVPGIPNPPPPYGTGPGPVRPPDAVPPQQPPTAPPVRPQP